MYQVERMFGILKIWLIQLGCSVLARIQLMFDFIIQILDFV